mmetsp:Transcript_24876/g.43497  ORF Transcript_24876/g.43497 Transcript_24876/m.43497 type:complete len:429 (+) Transcript_24876:171-1457(+)
MASTRALKSVGCDTDVTSSPFSVGSYTTFQHTFEGEVRTHQVGVPPTYDGQPTPLLLYFHGWGGSYADCGSLCDDALSAGFITLSMTGLESDSGLPSWNGIGSTTSPGPQGPTCEAGAVDYCYADCGNCTDNCWWTTCKDSVAQVLEVWDAVEGALCVDADRAWAAGCSNGGMFTFELAADPRAAGRLAGTAPLVGLPHPGLWGGPAAALHLAGFWGARDRTVPPLGNTGDPGVSVSSGGGGGWFYATARAATDAWGRVLGCDPAGRAPTADWGMGDYQRLANCTALPGCGVSVVECIFDGGHWCNALYQRAPLISFMKAHSRVGDLNASKAEALFLRTLLISLGVAAAAMVTLLLAYWIRRLRGQRMIKAEVLATRPPQGRLAESVGVGPNAAATAPPVDCYKQLEKKAGENEENQQQLDASFSPPC